MKDIACNILCVDDEEFILKSLNRIFMDTEFNLLTASSGAQALEILESAQQICVIVSDYRMPGMNGVQLLSEVFTRYPQIRRVVLSGYADVDTVLEAINSGHIHKFIPKPWEDDELLSVVRREAAAYLDSEETMEEGRVLKKQVDTLSNVGRALKISLAEEHELLKKSEAKLKRAEKIASLGDWEWYGNGGSLSWSDSMYSICAVSKESFNPCMDSFLELIYEDDRDNFLHILTDALTKSKELSFSHRIRLNHVDVRYMLTKCEPFEDSKGKRFLACTTLDDTDRIIMAENLRVLNLELEEIVAQRTSELEEKVAELDSFASAVSHDLRAPIRNSVSFAKILKEKLENYLEDVDLELLLKIISKGELALEMAETLLSLARLGKEGVNRTQFSVSEMAEQIIEDIKGMNPEHMIICNIEKDILVDADRQLVNIILTNLLSNAVKYSSRREKSIISLSSELLESGERFFVVEDNGAGYDMKYADKLFQPFQRLHTSKDFPGIGIGLATVYRIVRLHGGRIWGRSAIEKGAKFYFSLEARS